MSTDAVAVFGTRPEIIKLAPIVSALNVETKLSIRCVSTGQHRDLQADFILASGIELDHDLALMVEHEPFERFLRRALAALVPTLERLAPRAVLVQGDTSSALAGALAATRLRIPVVHIEAGLRSGDFHNPYPEEAIRVLISHCAALHCAPTAGNARHLRSEGIDPSRIVITGNPVVDGLQATMRNRRPSAKASAYLDAVRDKRLLLLTTHRRENFGVRLAAYLAVIRSFMDSVPDVRLLAPVHPNPAVADALRTAFETQGRVDLVAPMNHADFLHVLARADLALSDSGGVQEESASLGTPLIVLRAKTERPEAIVAGTAGLAEDAKVLEDMLNPIRSSGAWPARIKPDTNPFGDGHSGSRIARLVADFLH